MFPYCAPVESPIDWLLPLALAACCTSSKPDKYLYLLNICFFFWVSQLTVWLIFISESKASSVLLILCKGLHFFGSWPRYKASLSEGTDIYSTAVEKLITYCENIEGSIWVQFAGVERCLLGSDAVLRRRNIACSCHASHLNWGFFIS